MKTQPRSPGIVSVALGLIVLSAVSATAQAGQFSVATVTHSNSTTTLRWESAAGWNYTVQRSTLLASGSWTNVAGCADLPGTDGFLAAADTLQSASQAFYRVERYLPPYRHTITIDGVNDFTSGETFATSSSGSTAYITWDSTYLYVGMYGPDIDGGNLHKWILVYLDGSPGTATGVIYNTQQPQLPFTAEYHLRWRADGTFTDMMSFNGASWVSLGPGGNWYHDGYFLEWRIPLAAIGNPSQFDIHLSMINEINYAEWSYAAVPSTSFTDGYDPNYTEYYQFDMTGSAVPNVYVPKP